MFNLNTFTILFKTKTYTHNNNNNNNNNNTTHMNNIYCPLVEKYRPTQFNDIVLDEITTTIMQNIIHTKTFPNILLYGPPGTGKTTTIINLIKAYQLELGIPINNSSIIHLNASDERGIDIIRNQIYNFVISNKLFSHSGMKFVILDEADYMTKQAQQALKYILHKYSKNVRICLMCNYISKIEEGLLTEFVVFRFNQLPVGHITNLLQMIVHKENIQLSTESIQHIQHLYKSDIRSMINCIQTNQNVKGKINIITTDLIEHMYMLFVNKYPIHDIILLLESTDQDMKCILKYFFNYIIRNKPNKITKDILNIMLNAMHFPDCNKKYFMGYCVTKLYNKL